MNRQFRVCDALGDWYEVHARGPRQAITVARSEYNDFQVLVDVSIEVQEIIKEWGYVVSPQFKVYEEPLDE